MALSPDVIVFSAGTVQGRFAWVLYNVFSRTCLGCSVEGLTALQDNDGGLNEKAIAAWNIHYFSNIEGLLADPSRFKRDTGSWPEADLLSGPEFLKLARELCIIVDDEAAYRARFAPKTNLLDFKNFGSFHQQLGQELIIKHRINPHSWWIDQKFANQGERLKDNLYGIVQGAFLNRWFSGMKKGTRVVDVGCGTGFYAKMLAERGMEVIGVDPSKEYIAEATKNAVAGATFFLGEPGKPGGLSAVQDHWADVAFMSDALLYYFHAVDAGELPSLDALFSEIRRVLKPGGKLWTLEPHCLFYQQPWLGSKDRPFTAISEYRRRSINIVPTMSELLGAICSRQFAICGFHEIYPEANQTGSDERSFHFANEFPLWQLVESTPVQ